MLKKTFFQIHWFLGITAGLVLSIMGVTGAIYSYEPQILKWINQDSYVVAAQAQPKLSPAQIYQHFQRTQPELKINSITINTGPTASSSINIPKEGEKRGLNVMINPYTAALLPELKGREFFQFVQKLHRTLTLGPQGKLITGSCALMLIFFVLSGLYLRWPKKHSIRQWLAVKPQLKGRNFLWDLHAVVGTWVIVFYLMLAITGLYWSFDWWRNGMYAVLGVEREPAKEMRVESGKAGSNPQAGKEAPNPAANGTISAKQEQKSTLDTAKVSDALSQTWNGFNQKIGREYSSLTLNIPEKNNGTVELSFVDAVPQHERAKNTASYDYRSARIEKLKLYEAQPLNEKIMANMLPVHRGSFFGPLYQFLAMLASLVMPLFFITGWMLYLKRRKQKKLTQAARQALLTTTQDSQVTPWLIVYASQTGTAEQLAWRTASSLQTAQQVTQVKSLQHLTADELKQHNHVLFVVSTYGTGNAPDLAAVFSKKIMKTKFDLGHLNYAVLALGAKEYADSYCQFGHQMDDWLQACGANALFDLIEVDNAHAADIQRWNQALADLTQTELQDMSIRKVFDPWILAERHVLNPDSIGEPVYNIELHATHDALWQAGDIAEIQPANSPMHIQAFLQQQQIDTHTLVPSLNMPIQDALWNKDLNVQVHTYQNLDELMTQLPTLPTREYSIASIPAQQVLRLVVRQQKNVHGELGLGSGWLTHYAEIQQPIALRIRSNPSFHLIDDNRPVILIGNGTGIAGLMSLLHARVRQDHTDNWLIFGERKQAHDFLYQDTIQAWQTTGMLKRLDLAFSRDQQQRIYVQDKLHEQADELKAWINRGAVIYVCGSLNGMAQGVEQALSNILGEETLNELSQSNRYRRDVY